MFQHCTGPTRSPAQAPPMQRGCWWPALLQTSTARWNLSELIWSTCVVSQGPHPQPCTGPATAKELLVDSAATDQYGQLPLSSIPYPHAPCAHPAQASHFLRPIHLRTLLLRPPFTRMPISAPR